MTNTVFFSGNLLHNTMNGCLHLHLFRFFLPFQGQLSVVGYSQVSALVSKILFVNVSVHLCMPVCAAKFHFQFCCVYPATSLQSVDKEPAMTARANVAESLERLTEKVKLMAVNPEQLFRKGTDTVYRDSVAKCCSVNENVSTDLPAEQTPYVIYCRCSIFSHSHIPNVES